MSHEPGLLPALRRFFQSLAQTPALLWSFLYFFCLLSGYYVLRPVRDAMAASRDAYAIFPTSLIDWAAARGVDMGQTVIPILFTGTFLSMLLVQPIYGAIVSRFPRRVFLPLVYSFFVACLIGFHLLFDSGIAGRGAVFFIWLAVFNLFAVTVFWSFMADVFSSADAKRYYGYIAAGGTLGGFLGPSITRTLAPVVGVPNLLLVSAAFLSLCLVLILLLSPWARRREAEAGAVLEAAIAAQPEAVMLQWMQAGRLEAAGDIDGAIAVYEALYAANSANTVIANNLASLITTHRSDAQSLERAFAIARRLRGSDVPAFQDTYGWIEYRRGNLSEALAHLEPAAEGLPDNALVQFHLGMTYAALERPAEAVERLERALELAGESPLAQFDTARETLARLRATQP